MRNFLKLTFFKFTAFAVLIVVFILGRRMAVVSEFPAETIFFKLDAILFSPVVIISDLIKSACSVIIPESICAGSVYGISYFALNLLEYYLIACLLVYIFQGAIHTCRSMS